MKKMRNVIIVFFMTMTSVFSATITIEGDSAPGTGNCIPFGRGADYGPYMGFIYQNIPAFDLQPGDRLAFDLGAMNDTDIQLDIAMAPTVSNGSDVASGVFTTVVTNSQLPQNPRGDATTGNYELQFTVENAFSFSGGGLIIQFSNRGGAFAADDTCDQVLARYNASDTSGYFVKRFYYDADGLAPYDGESTGSIGGFQIITNDAAPAPQAVSVPLFTPLSSALLVSLFGFFGYRKLK